MKKSLIALLAFASIAASATTLTAEYNYNETAGSSVGASQYGYLGIAQETKYGTVDFGFQGANSTTSRFGALDQSGYEVGYSYPVQVGKFNVVPRAATGVLHTIDPSAAGFSSSQKYFLVSVEGQYKLSEKVGAYSSYSHSNSIGGTKFHGNRVQVGIDYTVTKALNLRAGYSFQKLDADNLNGLVAVASYSF